jgi:hypothetical protein
MILKPAAARPIVGAAAGFSSWPRDDTEVADRCRRAAARMETSVKTLRQEQRNEQLIRFAAHMNKMVVGQPAAIDKLTDSFSRLIAGVHDPANSVWDGDSDMVIWVQTRVLLTGSPYFDEVVLGPISAVSAGVSFSLNCQFLPPPVAGTETGAAEGSAETLPGT